MAKRKEADGRRINRNTLETYRFRAIKLRKKGWKVNKIAESFGIHRGSVSRWLTTYKRKGKKALQKRKAPGAKRKLETKEIVNLLGFIKRPATEFGFENPLWTSKKIQMLIEKKSKKTIHVSNIRKMLHAWNFTPQIPTKGAFEQKSEEVQKWLTVDWPKIKAHCRRWQAMLYFIDEARVSLIPVMGRTWAPKGETPIIKVTGKKGGLCVSSAISPAGRMVFRIERGKVTAIVHIEFLEQIRKHHPQRKVIVIEDKAPAHRAKKVKEFVQKNRKNFAHYLLPSYSPNLNPDEQTWKYLKQHK